MIFLDYSIWWSKAPRVIRTFLESYDLSGMAIALICTSDSNPLGGPAPEILKDQRTAQHDWKGSGSAEDSAFEQMKPKQIIKICVTAGQLSHLLSPSVGIVPPQSGIAYPVAIECTIRDLDGLQTEMTEIDENFVRADLSLVDYGNLLLYWKEIYETLHSETKSS